MRKLICDKCKKEVGSLTKIAVVGEWPLNDLIAYYLGEICEECLGELKKFIKEE